jgi:hypothetical protein
MEWWSGGVVGDGVMERWSDGVVEWWSGGAMEWWSDGGWNVWRHLHESSTGPTTTRRRRNLACVPLGGSGLKIQLGTLGLSAK